MKEAEEQAFQLGISQETLIRAVGQGIASHQAFVRLTEQTQEKPILLFVGRGCNGLDGLSLGLQLLLAGRNVQACFTSNRKASPLFDLFFKEFSKNGGQIISYQACKNEDWGLIIDALLGTGSHPIEDPELHQFILFANSQNAPIVSIDIPSGIDPETGSIWDVAIQADMTFACQAPKIGCFLEKAWNQVGTLYTIDIGLNPASSSLKWLELDDVKSYIPFLRRTVHKYTKGMVSLFAGSKGMVGAASLAAKACFKSGSGYVRTYLPNEAYTESLLLPIEAVRIFYENDQFSSVTLPTKGSCLIGPGCGRNLALEPFVRRLLKESTLPCVFDADALHAFPKDLLRPPTWKKWVGLNTISLKRAILTPHRGEASSLFGFSCEDMNRELIKTLSDITNQSGCSIVLKGSPTFLFFPNEPVKIMGLGTPALATAGTGDVLSGLIASFLAQGLLPSEASQLAVVLHALAGQEAAMKLTSYSVRASDVLDAIPLVLKTMISSRASLFHGK